MHGSAQRGSNQADYPISFVPYFEFVSGLRLRCSPNGWMNKKILAATSERRAFPFKKTRLNRSQRLALQPTRPPAGSRARDHRHGMALRRPSRVIHNPEVERGAGVALLGGLAVPGHRCGVVLRHALAVVVVDREAVLRLGDRPPSKSFTYSAAPAAEPGFLSGPSWS